MSDGKNMKISGPGGPPGDQRRHERLPVRKNFKATIIGEDGVEQDVRVLDISAGGAGLAVEGSFENDAFVNLHMDGYGKIPARVKREFLEGIGVEFELDGPQENDMEEELKKFRLAAAKEKG
ncbi:MAG: PilZ domain-containing protein [Proteobacteria bacterium]|nr:PilZ domain-containing protein [Pseudomonadota bacterium]